MPIAVPAFTTSASITGSTKVAQADEQLRQFMADTTTYMQSSYDTIANQLATDVSVYTSNAQTAATNASASATSAATSATTATTKATSATTSEANALASKNAAATSATNAATSATTATTKATEAATSASNASTAAGTATTQATASATSATNAASSATSAATSKTSVDTSLTSFGGMYVGAFATAPSTGAFGASLKSGSLYFNTTDNTMKWYNGTVWNTAVLDTTNVYTKTEVVAEINKIEEW